MARNCRFAIDRGGTFTDIYAEVPVEPGFMVHKLLSVDPENYDDAPREGIRRILEKVTGRSIPPNNVDTSLIESIRMGTTVATNALLERKGRNTLLVTTRGFRDLLAIGNQSRPKIFDLEIERPDLLYSQVIEVDERLRLLKDDEDSSTIPHPAVVGVTGEEVAILESPEKKKVLQQLQDAKRLAKEAGNGNGNGNDITSVAIVFLHAHVYSGHEEQVAEWVKESGLFEHVSLSSEVLRMERAVPRGQTVLVDAYLSPLIGEYVAHFCGGFDAGLPAVDLSFMQSDGGLCPMSQFRGSRAILSGPAGGVVAIAQSAWDLRAAIGEEKMPAGVIGFDMGGTSTDVCRFDRDFEHVYDATIAGVAIQVPQLDIQTVAAGGGSILTAADGLLRVGPESASANPGPACYRRQGPMAVTDANLVLGRLQPAWFPHIFGPAKNEPLSPEAALQAASAILASPEGAAIASTLPAVHPDLTPLEVLSLGFIRVANEAMCRPIRTITEARGHDARRHALCVFGGAGGQHACAIARNLGIETVLVHRFGSILSAYGLALADLVIDLQEPSAATLHLDSWSGLQSQLAVVRQQAHTKLLESTTVRGQVSLTEFLHIRYKGTDTAIMVAAPAGEMNSVEGYRASFEASYEAEYGFTLKGRDLLVDNVRCRASMHQPPRGRAPIPVQSTPVQSDSAVRVAFENGPQSAKLYHLASLGAGANLVGPAIILDENSTILVEPGCEAQVTPYGDVILRVHPMQRHPTCQVEDVQVVDPIMLSIFANRFMGIAEQMGRSLQRTAISTNIKERLDFSCAIFEADGGLIANAPHLPVHLGAMADAVRSQIRLKGAHWPVGEVVMSNHPCAGGSHLPDITVISPFFPPGATQPLFFVASRGHHADVGGITPGSMPPFSHTLEEEGAAIASLTLVSEGQFNLEGVREVLGKSRNLHDNIADLQAQVAANKKGVALLTDLLQEYGQDVVIAYMKHVMDNATSAVTHLLRDLVQSHSATGSPEDTVVVSAADYMDDGTPICLKLTVNGSTGSATFDFEGTGPEVYGNTNTPPAVVSSAVLYTLRSLVQREIPLNQGCLANITIHIPPQTILNPSLNAAVVGGNVLTSQRVTDVVLEAFGACANSQGCMNNLTFGTESWGYYETIAGGAGAGPTWHGKSGVHTGMTNTRITDPEVLERRYPVILRQFALREGSGGVGKWRGGEGVIRDIEFLRPTQVSMLSERRSRHPRGLMGGGPGAMGYNTVTYAADGRRVNIGGKNSLWLQSGDRLSVVTPGGGAYGSL